MKKRIFSAVLALIMVLGAIPFAGLTAFAENTVPTQYQKTYVATDSDGHVVKVEITADKAILTVDDDYANSSETGYTEFIENETSLVFGEAYEDAMGSLSADNGIVFNVWTGNMDVWVSNYQGMLFDFEEYVPHIHTKGTTVMTNGKAHWFACGGKDCPLKTVSNYVTAFADASTGAALKETLGYKETVDKGGLMGRQGSVSNEKNGRTIIGLTEAQLTAIEKNLVIVGSDGKKDVTVTADCAYTYFYDYDSKTGNSVKIEAKDYQTKNGEPIVAFVIFDKDAGGNAISGYGYYRLYNGEVKEDANFMFDVLYTAPMN